MHTVEQAKELWCPMVRIARVETTEFAYKGSEKTIVGGCNTDALGSNRVPASCRCIADKCAMWRWEHTTASVPVVKEHVGQKYTAYEQRTVRTHGFCGLAPLPQN